MIYLLYGENVRGALDTLKSFERRFRKEVPHEWQSIDFEDGDQDEKASIIAGDSLFARKGYYIIKHASRAEGGAADILKSKIKKWKDDTSVVVFFERGTPAKSPFFDLLKKSSKHEEFIRKDEIMRSGRDDRDLFALGDIWGRREKARLIVAYEELLRRGYAADEILRTLVWHAKNIGLAAQGKTHGMKPYVAGKAKDQARNFMPGALHRAFDRLVLLDNKFKKETLETELLYLFLTY